MSDLLDRAFPGDDDPKGVEYAQYLSWAAPGVPEDPIHHPWDDWETEPWGWWP